MPALLASIVETCLSKDPAACYQRGEEVIAELPAVESGTTDRDPFVASRRSMRLVMIMAGEMGLLFGKRVEYDRDLPDCLA